MLLSFFHTCASKQHHDLHDRESLILSLSYTSGNFHYRTWLVYSDDGLPQNALGLHEQASRMHTHLVPFVELSYTYSSSASVAWQSLLTHIDIYRWESPQPIDMPSCCETIFSLFVFSTTTILFHLQCYIHGSRSYIA